MSTLTRTARDAPGLLHVVKRAAPARPEYLAPCFPSPDLVGLSAATLAARSRPGWRTEGEVVVEGPRWFVTVSPGSVRVSSTDLARGQRAAERAQRAARIDAGLLAAQLLAHGEFLPLPDPTGRAIVAWSAESRANMVRRLVSLDYAPLVAAGRPAMVTLTYPGDWLTVAPDGATATAHLKAFRKRLTRAFDGPALAVWKKEYQLRGAPHYHLFMPVPKGYRLGCGKRTCGTDPSTFCCFRRWVGQTWAAVVAHPDPVQRSLHEIAGTAVDVYQGRAMTDPRRVAVYFTKHGALAGKEYQNQPPAEWVEAGAKCGRFWGYWGLSPVEVPVEVDPADALAVTRTVRKLFSVGVSARRGGRRYMRRATVWRTDLATGVQSTRTVRRPVRRMRGSAGYVSVNSGPAFAMTLERVVSPAALSSAERRSRFAAVGTAPLQENVINPLRTFAN